MITCTVCNEVLARTDADTKETNVCRNCRGTIGVVPMGQPVRPAVPCTRCNGMQFIRVLPRAYCNATGLGPPLLLPLTHKPQIVEGMFGSEVTSLSAGYFGALEVYICEGCGFIEWYCREPKSMPIGPQYMTERLDYAPKSEFR